MADAVADREQIAAQSRVLANQFFKRFLRHSVSFSVHAKSSNPGTTQLDMDGLPRIIRVHLWLSAVEIDYSNPIRLRFRYNVAWSIPKICAASVRLGVRSKIFRRCASSSFSSDTSDP